MRWIVFDKDGLTAKCEVRSLQYSGEFMGACSITAKVVSPSPVDFEIGDYLLYRGERFEINYDPTVLKQASSGSYGEGFVYDNIVFNSLSDELTRCDFLDYVPNDNNLHYSSLPNFSFFADSVQKLAERIQVNLDRIYTGDKQWTVNVNTEKTGKTDVNVVINNQTCWDALALVKSEFGLNFIVRGRTITIGTEGIAVGKVFSYGKGNGLISVERNAESDQKVITRLRAYGSTKNMPESYYKNVGLQVFGELIWRMFANTFYLNIPYEAKLFTKSSERGKEVAVKVNGEESTGYVTEHEATDEFEGCCELHFDSSELASKLQEGMKVYFTAHVNKTEFPRANKEYAENVPNNMAVRHLMLPSFPAETTDPYIDSENIGELGIREATIFFDGSNGNEEIYPSMEGMTAEDLKAAGVECAAEGALDEVVSAEQIEDDGFFKEGSTIGTFKITLKDVGFDINDHLSVSGNATIAFNTGMCGGRDFEIVECKKEGANYVLTCNRHYDESLDLYFPYKDYQIKSGDKFVLINIEMPDVYVQAASQRLLTAAKWYLGNNDYVRYSYVPRIDNIFLAREHDEAVKNGEASIHDTIKEGDLMLFHDTDLGIEGSVIIDSLSIREGESLIPEYEVTLRNNKTVGTITKIQNQIDSIVSGKTGTGGGYNAAQIKSLIDSYGQTLFLSKTKDDRSKGKIASDKAIEVGNYVSGASGAIIYKDVENGQTVAEFDKLYVRMKAYFENLEIINASTIGGKQIISPAGSVKCIGVEETDNAYRCYFLAEQDGEKVQNKWVIGDQAYSQMFNAQEGEFNNVYNKYYWRLVTNISNTSIDFEGKKCHYIDLSKSDCDSGSDIPAIGDVLNQRGNRTKLDRMNFIEMSSVDAFSPNITLFHGVNSYSLDGKAYVSYGVDKSTNKAFMDVYGDMYVGDRQNSSYMRYTQENGLEISGTLSVGTKLGDTPLKDLISASSPEGYQEFVEKVTQEIEGLQAQIDGAIESYFFQYDPTLGNYPASEWIANGTQKAHLNDTFTNLTSGYSWRWSLDGTTYKWVEITDTATTKALALAGQAKDTADGKRRVFVEQPKPDYDKGDLWSRGSEYPLMICINGKSKDKGEVYEASDWDYADNNAKLKEEMQDLVGNTKDELNNAIGQAKNEAVNNAKAYTDEGKQALQASIDAMESSKANLDDVYTRAQADGKISETEAKALKAAEEEADAAIAYYDTIVKAYADGVATEEELKEIQGAKAALDAAKKYAEEEAQKAIDEANNTYGYLAKALGTEVDGGLLLTSLIQMRDTDQNIMSGINGLTAKGDKSIATWWGGGMYDMFEYYDWDGAKWVAKKNIQIPSNVPSGVIRMDGTGYLAKGKFWWDESGKIYADPTALFLMFDVEDESASLSQTILAMRDKQTEFADMWEFKTDANGRKYLLSKYPLVTQEGITMYSGVGTAIPSIYDGLPIDGTTIYWENGILKAQGGGGTGGGGSIDYPLSWSGFSSGSFDGSAAKTIYIPSKLSELTNDSGYALSSALSGYLPLSGGTISSTSPCPLSINSQSILSYLYFKVQDVVKSGVGYYNNLAYLANENLGGRIGVTNDNIPQFWTNGDGVNKYTLWHSGNLNPSNYLPKSGGTIKAEEAPLTIHRDMPGSASYIIYKNRDEELGRLGFFGGLNTNPYEPFFSDKNGNNRMILHSSNYSSYALPISGGTINSSNAIPLTLNSSTTSNAIELRLTLNSANKADFGWDSLNGVYVYEATSKKHLGINTSGTPFFYDGKGRQEILHQNNYSSYALPLSGGRIDGASYLPLQINSTDASVIRSCLFITHNGGGKAQIGWDGHSGWGTFLFNYSSNGVLGITDDGTPYFGIQGGNLNTLIHLGNIGSQRVSYASNADKLDGLDSSAFAMIDSYQKTSNNNWNIQSGIYYTYGGTEGLPLSTIGNSVIHCNWDQNAANQLFLAYDRDLLSFRRKANDVWHDWKTIAFTDSNVASATKLQTARTIWGQSFDGTGNVSGIIEMDSLVYFKQNGTQYGYLGFASSDTNLYLSANNKLLISGNNDLILNGYSGNVGIGTTAPSTKLHVVQSNWDNGITIDRSVSGAGAAINVNSNGTNIGNFGINGNKVFEVNLLNGTNIANVLVANNAGNVGIGTTNPDYKLDVAGTFNASSNATIGGTLSVSGASTFTGKTTHNGGISANGLSFTGTHTITFDSNGNIALNSENGTYWHVDTYSGAQVLVCTSSGNVGIGNISPSYKLHVDGDIRGKSIYSSHTVVNTGGDGIYFSGSGIYYHNSNNSWVSDLITFDSGSVNLRKNTDCLGTLSVASTSTFTGKTTHNGGLESTVSSAYSIYGNSSTSRVCIAGDNGKSLYIASKGNSADYYLVSVNYGQTTLGSGGSNAFTIRGDGNVGIGQNAPSAKLHVAGNILTSGSITMNSMRSMKNIINENGLSLEELSTIKPTRFTWKDGRDNRIHVGGIADDVMKVLPEVVFKGSDGVLSMDYASAAFVMAASLIQPMTEHERRIANLERENALLKEEIRNLKSA